MPWWGWLLLAIPALLVLYIVVMSVLSKAFRALIRRELTDFVLTVNPDAVVADVTPKSIRISLGPQPPWELALEPVYAATRDADSAQRRFLAYWYVLSEACAESPQQSLVSVERHRDLVWPQLVVGETPFPGRPLGTTGLKVTYAIKFGEESGARNAFLRGLALPLAVEHMDVLGVDESTLFDWSMKNLAGSLPEGFVANVVDSREASALQTADHFVACRILAVPSQLQDDQTVVALIPDRESLVLMPPPDDGDWTNIFEAALIPLGAGAPLLELPVKVTRAGFELVEPPMQDSSDES